MFLLLELFIAGAQVRGNQYGQGTGPIYVDAAGCNGREDHIFDCNFDANTNDDNHGEDVGVSCRVPGDKQIYTTQCYDNCME